MKYELLIILLPFILSLISKAAKAAQTAKQQAPLSPRRPTQRPATIQAQARAAGTEVDPRAAARQAQIDELRRRAAARQQGKAGASGGGPRGIDRAPHQSPLQGRQMARGQALAPPPPKRQQVSKSPPPVALEPHDHVRPNIGKGTKRSPGSAPGHLKQAKQAPGHGPKSKQGLDKKASASHEGVSRKLSQAKPGKIVSGHAEDSPAHSGLESIQPIAARSAISSRRQQVTKSWLADREALRQAIILSEILRRPIELR